MTPGTDGINIVKIRTMPLETIINRIQSMAENYKPSTVRRVWIPKPNGKQRPIGIPTLMDRLFQQCVKQVIEPICEAKFHPHSYGFRPNRSAKHALARASSIININGLHYVVDIDIKSFFDTIDHGKLLKQCWSVGIRDKKVLSILSKMLKAEIVKEGIPEKGTPQGGILSPLLSNICLNELDWWLSSQWATFRTNKSYSSPSKTWRALRQRSRLKEFHAVRYADDFKIFCRDYKTAKKIFIATQQWLEARLKLQISTEKSSITNLRKKSSPFLGILLRSRVNKKHRLVCRSRVMPKAMQNMLLKLKSRVSAIQKSPTATNVSKFNTTVLGLQNYYNAATDCSVDFGRLNHVLKKFMRPRLKSLITYRGQTSKTFRKRYSLKSKPLFINGVALFPVYSIKHKNLYQFTQEMTPYTKKGRQLMHKELDSLLKRELERWHLTFGALEIDSDTRTRSIEYFDNRISKWSAQKGRCGITGTYVGLTFHCHHKIPVSKGGTDRFNNLVIVAPEVHNLIHATAPWIISETLKQVKLLGDFSPKKWNEILRKLNTFREQIGLNPIGY
jgi:group II intron reverse transcriptase/maturase